MTAIDQNAELWAGDNSQLAISLFQSDGTTPLDLTGTTINWGLSSIYDRGRVLVHKTSTIPGEIEVTEPPSAGTIKVFLVPPDTSTLGGQPYYHEVEVLGGGTTITVTTGKITIHKTALH